VEITRSERFSPSNVVYQSSMKEPERFAYAKAATLFAFDYVLERLASVFDEARSLY